jgi:hypothetical protein
MVRDGDEVDEERMRIQTLNLKVGGTIRTIVE